MTALTVNNDNEGNGGDNNAGNIFSGSGAGGGGSGGAGGGAGGGDDQAVASAFRILKVSAVCQGGTGVARGSTHCVDQNGNARRLQLCSRARCCL